MRTLLALLVIPLSLLASSGAEATRRGTDSADDSTWKTFLLADSSVMTARVTDQNKEWYWVRTPSGNSHKLWRKSILSLADGDSLTDRWSRPWRLPAEQTWAISLSSEDSITEVGLGGMSRNSLLLGSARGQKTIPIENIVSLRRKDGSNFWSGLLVGSAVGAGIGVPLIVLAETSRGDSGLGFGFAALVALVAGPIVGGIIGATGQAYKEIDLSSLDRPQKAEALYELIDQER